MQVPSINALPALSLPAHQAGPGGGHHGLHQQEVSLPHIIVDFQWFLTTGATLFYQVWAVHHQHGEGAEGGLGPAQSPGRRRREISKKILELVPVDK